MICDICGVTIRQPTKDTKALGFCGKCRVKKWLSYVEILKEKKVGKEKKTGKNWC